MLATATVQGSPLAYALLFVLALAGWAGVPAVGAAGLGTAAVLASQHQLSIAAVLVVASAGAVLGGLVGYAIGKRWGTALMERPGRREQQRRRALTKGQDVYDRWGWLAVFFTPAWVAGVSAMRYGVFVVFNSMAAVLFVLATGLPAYGAGKVSSGHTDSTSVASLVGGLALAAALVLLFLRYRRRRAAISSPPGEAGSPAMGDDARPWPSDQTPAPTPGPQDRSTRAS
jgi:MYXO-CTERM domain-containing protein